MALPDESLTPQNPTNVKPEENPPAEDPKNGDSEPLLIGDGTPSWLMCRLLALRRKTRNPGDSFACVLDVLMHEAGFSSYGAVNESLSFDIRVMRSLIDKEIQYDNENSCYHFEYVYGDVKNRCDLVITPSSGLIFVNILVPDSKAIPLIFTLSDYIEFDVIIKNGQQLSSIIKEALHQIKVAFGYPNQLIQLPMEMLITLSQFLTADSFAAFTSTCKMLRTLYDDESIWRVIARCFLPARNNFPVTTYRDFVIHQFKNSRSENFVLYHFNQHIPLYQPMIPYYPDVYDFY